MKNTAVLAFFLPLICPIACLAADTFVPLGYLPGQEFGNELFSISDSGKEAAGTIALFERADHPLDFTAARWTESQGIELLGGDLIPDEPPPIISSTPVTVVSAGAISGDGVVIAGNLTTNPFRDRTRQSYRWTPSSGIELLPDVLGGRDSYGSNAISGDGTTIAGWAETGEEFHFEQIAVAWKTDNTMIVLGDLPGGNIVAAANAVSHDGSVIVGFGDSEEGTEAFRWTEETGMVGLGLPSGYVRSEATNISADGSIIVGSASLPLMREAFRWSQATEYEFLGSIELMEGDFALSSSASAASSNGSIVVGSTRTEHESGETTFGGFVWHESFGMMSVTDYLEQTPELEQAIAGWILGSVRDISPDGRVIAGSGLNPDGLFQGWIVRLDQPIGIPEPSSLVLLFLASLFVLLLRLNSVNQGNAL